MAYWTTAFRSAWRETKLWAPIKAVPSLLAAGISAYWQGVSDVRQWIWPPCILLGTYIVLYLFELLGRVFVTEPMRLYQKNERLEAELSEIRQPKLEILFEPRDPYVAESPDEYKLFRVGARVIGARTVDDVKAQVICIDPRPTNLFPPLFLQAMHDRPERKLTVLHPYDEWFFDVADQWVDGSIHVVHTVSGVSLEIPRGRYILNVAVSGRDVPRVSMQFVLWTPETTQKCGDLQFEPMK